MKSLSSARRITLLFALFAAMLGALLLYGPIPQDPAYHLFADTRPWLGISNFGDVATNAGLTIAGLLGLRVVHGLRAQERHRDALTLLPFGLYFFAVILVSAGSAYYHLAPGNDRLFWDRLPIAIALTAWFSGIVADRIDERAGVFLVMPVLVCFGALGAYYWSVTETAGQGDLRFYAMAQFYPLAALPLVCWLFPKAQYTGNGYLFWIFTWFAVSKMFEHFDKDVFALTGYIVSGHSLKHLALGAAALVVVRMLARNARAVRPSPG